MHHYDHGHRRQKTGRQLVGCVARWHGVRRQKPQLLHGVPNAHTTGFQTGESSGQSACWEGHGPTWRSREAGERAGQ